MIENLTPLSFSQYGEVVPESINHCVEEANHTVRKISVSDTDMTCYANEHVYLKREYGMPVLLVAKEDSAEFHRFYLDKPVRIHAGIWFAIAILGDGMVTQSVSSTAHYKKRMLPHTDNSHLLSASVFVGDIYTLFYQEREKGFFFPGEEHEPFELVYVDKGRLHSVINGQDHLLKQGQLMLYLPNQWHMQYADKDCPVSFFTVSFSMQCSHIDVLSGRRLTAGNEEKRLLSRMLEEAKNSHFLYEDMLLCYLKELIVTILRKEHHTDSSNSLDSLQKITRENEIVEAAQRYISENLKQSLTVEVVAQNISVSASYMTTLFRKHLCMSPGRYIRKVKLSTSKEMLQGGHYNLTEVSQLLGYATLSHFSRCFKEEYGIPPSEYARAMR